ncbi:DUF3833 family protein [uncultured Jannaschia sp.]|uniref:DUF3833 family protein n=1 Tax=uncultured Jannaschia sp. TaxID=293347 RepID=UPI00263A129E|nr:DUF3833 family protein [uncultured Jannaschia sp.]
MPFLIILLMGIAIAGLGFWGIRRIASFKAQRSEDYRESEPRLDLRRHVTGQMNCRGIIFGPTGRVTSQFRAVMETRWSGPTGVMDELFVYDDGSRQSRQWRLTIGGDGSLRAEADDVIRAGHGQVAGNTLRLEYVIRLPRENGGHVLDAVDWMYLQADGTILNRSQFRKWGVKVAELFCVMTPEEHSDA